MLNESAMESAKAFAEAYLKFGQRQKDRQSGASHPARQALMEPALPGVISWKSANLETFKYGLVLLHQQPPQQIEELPA